MEYDPSVHDRRSIRLAGYDYSLDGYYFVTVCVEGRDCIFGSVRDGEMELNEAGRLVLAAWEDLPAHYAHVGLDAFVVMPNHIHGIIVLRTIPTVGAGFKPAPTDGAADGAGIVGAGLKPAPTTTPTKRHGLPEIVRALKTFSARRINEMRGTPGAKVWQRNYYEHIIRNDRAWHQIRYYIAQNPVEWQNDRENPVGAGLKPAPTPAPTKDEPWRV